MKHFNALAHRGFLLLVAIVASAVTLHVRQYMTEQRPIADALSHAQYGRMCAPSSASGDRARALPADCDMRGNPPRQRIALA